MSVHELVLLLDTRDRALSGRLSARRYPPWLHAWMQWSTRLGDGWAWVLVGALLLPDPATWPAFLATAQAAAAANVAVVLLKGRVRRPRPSARVPHPALGGWSGRLSFDEFSFPSGHALNAFALAGVLGPVFPPAAPLLLVLAASIAASRVVLGVHFLADVVAGALLGTAVGLLCWATLLG